MTLRAPNWNGSNWMGSMLRKTLNPLPLVLLSVSLSACAGKNADESETPEEGADPAAEAGADPRDLTQMKTLRVDGTFCDRRGKRADQSDTNHDNRADLVTLYDAEGKITCKQADLNFDGKLDAFFHYSAGELKREQYDQDHDGRIDAGRYLKDGQVYLLEQDLNGDGYVDTWRRYDRGRLVRLENDRDYDGKADLFVHYVGGKIDRVGYDVDGNGKVDQWDHDAARRAAAALDTLAAASSPIEEEEAGFVEEPAPEGPASGAVEGGSDEDVGKVEEREGVTEDDGGAKTMDDDKPAEAEKAATEQNPSAQKPAAQTPAAQKPAAQRPKTQSPGQ